MKQFSKLLIVGILSVLIVSCGKDRTREQQVSAMINKIDSPFFIASMNVQNLMDKSEVMKEGTLPFTYYQVISFFLAVELTGIDYDTKAQFIVGEGESFLPNFYGIFKVKNEDLFIELLEVEANATIQEKEGMKYAIKDKEGYCVVWSEEFAVISNIPMDLAAMLSGKGGKSGEKMVDKHIAMINAAEDGDVNEDYVAFLEKSADISMLYEGKGFYQYMKSMSMDDKGEVDKLKDVYEGMSYQMFMNFDQGEMTMEMEAHLDDKLKKQLAFIGEVGVKEDLLKYGKSKNPLMTGSYKVDLPGMLAYLEKEYEEDYTEAMQEMEDDGLAIEDVKAALSGEMVFMIDEIIKKEEVYDFGYDEPITINKDEPLFGVVLGVDNKGIIEKKMQEMMMKGMQDVASTDEEMMGYPEDAPKMEVLPNGVVNTGDAFIYLTDEVLFMSNDSSWANLIAEGGGVKVENPNGVINENPMGMYADFTKMTQLEMDKDASEMLQMLHSFFGSANLDGGKFTLKFKDDSQNSLKIITQSVGAMLAKFEEESNPDMMKELDEAVEETQNGEDPFEKLEDVEINEEDVEKAVDDALKEVQGM